MGFGLWALGHVLWALGCETEGLYVRWIMGGYKNLDIYRSAHRLAVAIHKLSLDLPKFELFEEGSQVRRSSKAVSANIVEGFCRKRYQQDYMRFMIIAHASCNETIEHLDIL